MTLIELMAALGIFSVLAVGLMANTVAVIHSNVEAKNVAAAATLINDKIEELRGYRKTELGYHLSDGLHDDPEPLDPLGRNGGEFTRTWMVERDTPETGLAKVEVRVTWNEPDTRSVSVVTYVCQTSSCT